MIRLQNVQPKDRDLLWNINQKYLYEMTNYYDDPMDEEGNVYMVRQYRYPVGAPVLEIPAGKIDHHDEHIATAKRELSEETGFSADEYIDLGCCYTSPGYTDEIIHVYLARGLHKGKSHLDEGEFLNVEKLPFDALFGMVMRNEIIEAKTIIAVSKAKLYLEGHGDR